MAIDYSDLARAARAAEEQSNDYGKQWLLWMVLCSAGGIGMLLVQASQLCSPEYALRALAISYVGFAVGMAFSWSAFGCKARESAALADHLASAYNREQFKEAADKIPTFITAPASMAKRMNAPKDALIAQCNSHHERAESAWSSVVRWRQARQILTIVAGLAIVVAIAWVLAYVSFGGRLTPEHCVSKR
jgi:hypothetical protein